MQKTENKTEELEDEKILTLHFYDEYTDIGEYVIRLDSLSKCYELMCQLFGVSASENKLRVIKIESGSLFEKFIGKSSIIDAIAFLIKKTTELIFNKFTFEGQVLRQQQIIGLLKENSEVIAKYKELGFDIDPNIEEVEKVQSQIFKSIHRMVSRNTKIKINDDVIALEDSYKQKYLTESKTLLIDDSFLANSE